MYLYANGSIEKRTNLASLISRIMYGKNKNTTYLNKFTRSFSSTVAYIVTKEDAKKITKEIEKNGMQNLPIDVFYHEYLMKNGIIKTCSIKKDIIKESNEEKNLKSEVNS